MKQEIKFRAWRDISNSKFENATEVYRHTPKGMLTNLFQKLSSRNELKGYGTLSFTLGDFQTWAMNNSEFLRLFNLWVADDYSKKSKPSVDRINPYKGYEFSNMQWLSWNENYLKGVAEVSEKKHKPIIMLKNGVEIGKFKSVKDAQYFLGLKSNGDITLVLQGKRNTVNGYAFRFEDKQLLEGKQ
ncbi:hypothetical protein BVJ53_14175 [Lacticaseibacillus chiayiensis]|uniref:DNA endonuclease I-HmuI-like NUMOD-like domain-containing protein n=1 Tax=Lacticaseibacillus chiayiensis TaxID=2100821 RepID=A0A4Q1THK1_9LACO|nr:hypothetical protein [Lacticaseibacillus chiayiensis]RXT17764.1 hypothetical protein BVJ53_14175 [Lacticaseibacillus chiayiensis]